MSDRRKPLSFDTTLRNPGRIVSFVSVISKFEGQLLDENLIIKIEAEITRWKLATPTKGTLGTYRNNWQGRHGKFLADDTSLEAARKVTELYDKWRKSKSGESSLDDIIYLMKNTVTDHKDAGFKYGWSTRFHTQTIFLNELGFTYLRPGKKVMISPNGKLLISQYDKNGTPSKNYDENPENSAYLTAFAKYQTNNPWRHNTVKVNFLKLFLQTASYLDSKYNSKGIHRRELAFFIVWPNNDYKGLADLIYKFRKNLGFNALLDDEKVYDYALNVLDPTTDNFQRASMEFKKEKESDYKISKILRETPDDVMRKLRQSKIVSLRGNGYYLDINNAEKQKIDYIVNNINNHPELSDSDYAYFNYIGALESKLAFNNVHTPEEERLLSSAKKITLRNKANEYNWDKLKFEMAIACGKEASDDMLLKEIDKPTRMEFLAAIVMCKALPSVDVEPNYKVDDEGIPYNHASGATNTSSGADINVYQGDTQVLLEPTISKTRSFQVEHEIPSIKSHLMNAIKKSKENHEYNRTFSMFLADKIVKGDVADQVEFFRYRLNVNIYLWESTDYIEFSKNVKSLNDYAVIRPYGKMSKKVD